MFGHKNNEMIPFVTIQINLEIIILSEVSQTGKDKYHMIALICGIFLKNDTIELLYKTEIEPQTENTNLCLLKEKGKRDKLGVWNYHIHATIYKMDNQQGPPV